MRGQPKVRLTVASGPYIHLAALGRPYHVDDGFDLRHEVLDPPEILSRMHRNAAWDIGEMSLATVYMLADQRDSRFVPLPVFPSREFRHAALYVRTESPIRGARDLRGSTVGVLRYAMTTAVWVRGILATQYDVCRSDLHWVVGDDSPYPSSLSLRKVAGPETLERMALAGELDCLITGRTPASFLDGRLRRLFPDFGTEERAYFTSTGIFPIMHVMAAQGSLLQRYAEIVPALLKRFDAAKRDAEHGLLDFDISMYPVPWLGAHVEEARRRMGELWPYGMEKNRTTLVAFGHMMAADGLTSRALAPEEVFRL